MNILRVSSRLCSISSSRFYLFISKQGKLNTLKILSLGFHSSNQYSLRRPYPYYAFEDVSCIDEAVRLFDQMIQMKPMSPILDFNKLLNIVVKMEQYAHVVVMFKELSLLGCPVNEYTMNIVVDCYCKLREVEMGFAVVGSLVKRGFGPDVVTFSCIIKGLFLKESVNEAVDLFCNLIRDKMFEVNDVIISTVLDGLSKSGNVESAVQLVGIAEKRDWKVNVAGYSTVIDGLCKGGMLKDGMAILFKMIDRDVLPNVVTYNTILHGLCSHGKLDFARYIFSDLSSKGIYPDVITYTVMIQGLCGEGLFQVVKEMVEEMDRIGCRPNSVTYNIITRGCLRHHDSFYSINLLRLIIGRDFQLDASTFFLLLRKMDVLRQMQGIYDADVIDLLMRKLIFNDTIHLDSNDDVIIRSLIQKLNSK